MAVIHFNDDSGKAVCEFCITPVLLVALRLRPINGRVSVEAISPIDYIGLRHPSFERFKQQVDKRNTEATIGAI